MSGNVTKNGNRNTQLSKDDKWIWEKYHEFKVKLGLEGNTDVYKNNSTQG